MLKDELQKIDVSNDTEFTGSAIILFCPTNNVIYKIAFGDGTNAEDLADGCDDYMYITMDTYNDEGFFYEDIDGGQFEFAREDYTGFINDEKLIRDCLKFVDCKHIDDCVLFKKYTH